MHCLCKPIFLVAASYLVFTTTADTTTCEAAGSVEPPSNCKRKGQSGSGIALLAVNWHRSQRIPDAGDGHLGDDMPALEPAATAHAAKPVDLFQEDMSSKTVPVLNEGISAKNIPLPQDAALSRGIPVSELPMLASELPPLAGSLDRLSESPKLAPSASDVAKESAKLASSASGSFKEDLTGVNAASSHSFSSSEHSQGLTGSIPIEPGSAIDQAMKEYGISAENASIPAQTEEQFEPFGYPGAGLLLELHMPEITLRELHSSARGSLAQFLLEVRGELRKGAAVEEPRIAILGIHGRYKRYEADDLFRTSSEKTSHEASQGHPSHMDEEVVVRFEILPGWNSELEPRQALNALRDELSSSGSAMMRGTLSTILANATVTLSAPSGMGSQPHMIEHHGMAHMSAMAWPIGISAAFIGILIWLAAY